jgi:hypothetical protein
MPDAAVMPRSDGRWPQFLKRLTRQVAIGLLLAAAFGYCVVAGALYSQQRSILFHPDPTRVDPRSVGFAEAREIELQAPGAPRLIAWYVPPATEAQPIYLYLHGNASNLGRRAGRFRQLTREGHGLLALSWRGFGGSEGKPSEAGFHEDVATAIGYLRGQGIGPERIILYGESLGTGMAVMTAARLAADGAPVKATILDSPYESIAAIASERYWWLPVRLLLRDPFRADLAAPRVTSPTFAVLCTGDWLTPYEGGRRLLALLGGPKQFVTLERRCHAPTVRGGVDEAIDRFLAGLKPGLR